MSGRIEKRRRLGPVELSALLRMIVATGNLVLACEALNLDAGYLEKRIDSDPDLAEKIEAAHKRAFDRLEGEAYRRAVIGVEEPVFHKGQRVGHVRKYSDTLLIKLLEANDTRYGSRLKLVGENGPIEVQYNLENLTTAQLEALEALLATAQCGEGES